MNRTITAILSFTMPILLNAATDLNQRITHQQGKALLVVAVKDDSGVFGTDSTTTTSPNEGMNTMPTKDVGNEENTVNQEAPVAQPGQAPEFNPPPDSATPPAYTPPTNESGTLSY